MASKQVALVLCLVLIASLSMGHARTSKSKKRGKSKVKQPMNMPLLAFVGYTVEIHNDLGTYKLNSHCYSKDDDLGLHVLDPGQQQDWSFKGNWLGRTVFHCRLEWEKGFKEFAAFYFDGEFLTQYCGDRICVWIARPNGIYLERTEDGEPIFTLYWKMLLK